MNALFIYLPIHLFCSSSQLLFIKLGTSNKEGPNQEFYIFEQLKRLQWHFHNFTFFSTFYEFAITTISTSPLACLPLSNNNNRVNCEQTTQNTKFNGTIKCDYYGNKKVKKMNSMQKLNGGKNLQRPIITIRPPKANGKISCFYIYSRSQFK